MTEEQKTWGWTWIRAASPEEVAEAVSIAGDIMDDWGAFLRARDLYNRHHTNQLQTDCNRCRTRVARHFEIVRQLTS